MATPERKHPVKSEAVAKHFRQLVEDLKEGKGRNPDYGRRKAQWEIDAEREDLKAKGEI